LYFSATALAAKTMLEPKPPRMRSTLSDVASRSTSWAPFCGLDSSS
jgi:hypothetical protein